jgi:putative transposase
VADLVGTLAMETGTMRDTLCKERGWRVISKEIQPDHIHLLVSVLPAMADADAVKVLQETTARWLFQRFPSCYLSTAGHVSAETIRCSIDRSEHGTQRR